MPPGRRSAELSKAGLSFQNPGVSTFQPPRSPLQLPQGVSPGGSQQSRKPQDTALTAPPATQVAAGRGGGVGGVSMDTAEEQGFEQTVEGS